MAFCAAQAAPRTAAPACPPDLRGRLAYVSPSGLILCRSLHAAIVLTSSSDATAIAFLSDGTRVQYRSRGHLHVYDTATRRDRIVTDPNPYCDAALAMCRRDVQTPDGRWRLSIVQDPMRNGMPAGAALIARSTHATLRVHSGDADDLDFAAIAPDSSSVLFWTDPQHSASMMADTVPLNALALPRASNTATHAAALGMNGYPLRDWISFAPGGRSIVAIAGELRMIFHSERLVRCDIRATVCRNWNHHPGYVELDPAWSPDGKRIAFVRAAELGEGGERDGLRGRQMWNATRRLYLAAATANAKAAILDAAGTGVSWPTWIAPDRLLFVARDSLREINIATGNVRVLANLADRGDGYYGYVARSDRFAWAR